jgi:hypothetical protein
MSKKIEQASKPRHKTRYHRVLFDQELPFEARREELKNEYQRKPKYGKKDWYDEED